jgi:quercetin dioxygenase-like cupin family protein
MLHVHEGTLTLSVDGTDHVVATGAAALFDADRPHGYANRGRKPLRFTMVASAPSGQYDRRDGSLHGDESAGDGPARPRR